jgi:hypothetical protein
MEWVSKETLSLLYFLLPGFLAASVFYSLTAHPKKDAFERVIQALIFTVVVKTVTIGVRKLWWMTWHPWYPNGVWTDDMELVWSVTMAVGVGLVLAVVLNWDLVHRPLRRIRVTKRTSYPSEWYSAFHRFRRDVILHLTGERRLKGWADEWPDQSDRGHFLIQEPVWLDEMAGAIPFTQVKRLVIAATDVEMVEFIYNSDELPKSVEEIIKEQKPLVELHRKLKEIEDGKRAESTSAKQSPDPADRDGRPEVEPVGNQGDNRSLLKRGEAANDGAPPDKLRIGHTRRKGQ